MAGRDAGGRAAAAAAFALLCGACTSSGPLFTVEGALYAPRLSGNVGLASTQVTDVDTIDLASQFDLGNREYVPYLRADLNGARLDFALSGFRTRQSGRGTVTADFGQITAGSTVNSDLDFGLLHARLVVDAIDLKWLVLGAGLGAEYVDLKLDAREPVFALNESVAVRQALPLVVARGIVRPPALPFDLQLEVGGLTGHYQDVDGTLLDAEALLHWNVAGPFSLFGGYRYLGFRISGHTSSERFDGEVKLAGLLIGATLHF
jgi:hypothetical protein